MALLGLETSAQENLEELKKSGEKARISNVTKASIKMEQGVYCGPSIKLLFKTRSQGWTSS